MSTLPGFDRAWVRDAAVVGAGVGLGFPAALLGVVLVLEGTSSIGGELEEFVVASFVSATVVCVGSAPPAAFLADRAWRWSPALAMGLGPLLGSLGAAGLLVGLSVGLGQQLPPADLFLFGAIAGAFGLGPPWVAYLAVRSRGRDGLGVALSSPVWMAGAIAFSVGWAWLRYTLGYGPR